MAKNRLKKLRQKKGMTLSELSNDMKKGGFKFSADGLAKYERGDREPKLEKWQELADYFNVDVGYLQGIVDYDSKDIDKKMVSDFNSKYAKNAKNVTDPNDKSLYATYMALFALALNKYFSILEQTRKLTKRDPKYTHYFSKDLVSLLKQEREFEKNINKFITSLAQATITKKSENDAKNEAEKIKNLLQSHTEILEKMNNIINIDKTDKNNK